MFSGASFSANTGGAGRQLPLANAMQQWAAQRREQETREALIRVQNSATQAQSTANLISGATGVGLLAEAPDDTTGIYREAFQQQARAVFGANMALEATRTASKLSRDNPANPEGFAQQYNAWMAPQVEALREVDATAAFELQQRLDDLGIRHQNRLAEQAAGAAQEAERSQFFSDIQSLSAEYQDNLLQEPDMESLEVAELAVAERLAEGRAGNLITASQEINERERANATLRTEYARGRFNNALEAGDVGGARGVITMLREGELFDDNATGRTLADRLAREFAAATEAAAAVSSEQLSIANRTISTAEATGTGLDNPQVQQALDVLVLGDEADRDKANRFTISIGVREQFGSAVNVMNPAELDATLANLQNNPAAFDQEIAGELRKQIEDRRQELADVAASGNPLNARGELQLGATPADIQRARAESARALGLPLDEVPLINDRIAGQAAAELTQAQAAGDAGRAVEVIEQMMVGAGDMHDRQNIALTAGDPALAGFATMAALAPDTAETLFGLAFQGRNTTQQRREQAIDKVEGARDVIFETAERLSGGRPAVRDALEVQLTNALTSLVNDFEARGTDLQFLGNGVMREFKSLLAPFEDEVELANGARLPAGTVTPPEIAELNNALSDPDEIERRFGEAMLGDPATLASLTPVPLPGGQWAFRSSRTGRMVFDAEGEPIKLDPRPAVQAATDRQLTEASTFVGRIFKGRTPTQQALEVDIPAVARVTANGDARMLEAVFKAGLKVPPGEKLGREYTMLWAEGNVNEIDDAAYERAWREAADSMESLATEEVPDPTRDPLGGKIAAALLMDKFADRYGDGDKALAAYFIGADVIDEAGDDWRKIVPDDVFMFIERVKAEM